MHIGLLALSRRLPPIARKQMNDVAFPTMEAGIAHSQGHQVQLSHEKNTSRSTELPILKQDVRRTVRRTDNLRWQRVKICVLFTCTYWRIKPTAAIIKLGRMHMKNCPDKIFAEKKKKIEDIQERREFSFCN